MRTAAVLGKCKAGIIEVPNPSAKDDIVVVKVHSAPMCTEYHSFVNGDTGNAFGHEAAGEVYAIHKANKLKVGDRVIVQPQSPCGRCFSCMEGDFIHCKAPRDYCRETGSEYGTATMAQFILKAEDYLTPIPDDMSYDHASMACCALGPSFTAMERMNVSAYDTVLVSGLGPVGQGAVINARFRGATVIAADSHPYRCQLALELGASKVFDPSDPDTLNRIMEFTKGKGVDKSVETSGRAEAKALLIDVLRARGRAALIGWGGNLSADTIISKGLEIFGAWHYNLNDAGKVLKLIEGTKPLLDKLVTHTFPLTKIEEAWTVQASGNCGKVILHPWEE